MDIKSLLKRSGIESGQAEIEQLKADLESIIKLLEEIPQPSQNFQETEFLTLHEDEEDQKANKEELLKVFHCVQKDMIKI